MLSASFHLGACEHKLAQSSLDQSLPQGRVALAALVSVWVTVAMST